MCNSRCIISNCTECMRRAQEGPNYDPKRRTGRTTGAVMQAVLAAACGHRVLFVTSNHDSVLAIIHMGLKMLTDAKVADSAVEAHTAERITFVNGGWLEVRSMSGNIEYRGIREPHCPTLQIWDHHATEKKAEAQRVQEEQAASATIKALMRKHGWSKVEDHIPGPVRKLIFRT